MNRKEDIKKVILESDIPKALKASLLVRLKHDKEFDEKLIEILKS